jgi:Tfp pilus assembly PilM family ATPase
MRSVGIHVDSRKIRILDMDISSNKLALRGLFEMDRGSGDSLSDILRSYFAGTSRPDRVVASVGSVPIVVKSFSFPFKERTQVNQAILGDFEDSLPIDIEQFVMEFQLLGRESGSYNFIGAIVSREPLEDMNRVFETIDVVPSDFLVPSEALGKLGLSLLSNEFTPGSVVCFCDIGFDATQVCVVEFPRDGGKKFKASSYNRSMIDFRHISRGSKDIYDREGDKQALSVREFEEWLAQKVNFTTSSDDMKNAVRPLLVELYQVTQAAMSKSGGKVAHFVLTGALSQCGGFREFFETELRTPSLVWDPFQTVDITKSPVAADTSSRFVIPFALAMRHGAFKALPWLNFRRSSKRKQVISAALEQLAQPEFRARMIPLALLTIAIFVVSMVASVMMETRLEKQGQRTQGALTRAKAPLGSNREKLLSDPSSVSEQFNSFKTKRFAALPGKEKSAPMLEDLSKISAAMPANTRVEELKINANGKGKTFQATLNVDKNPSFSAEQLQGALKAHSYTDVVVDGQGATRQLKMKGN